MINFRSYRVTRPEKYSPSEPGHLDKAARLGYYILADNEEQARAWIRIGYNISQHEMLDVEIWKDKIDIW